MCKQKNFLVSTTTILYIPLHSVGDVYPHQTLILRNDEMSQVNIASMRKQNKLCEYYSRINTLMVFLGQIHVHAMITTVLVCFIQMKCNISQRSPIPQAALHQESSFIYKRYHHMGSGLLWQTFVKYHNM